jgi:ADP-heptose:LPS heptosyltransferase
MTPNVLVLRALGIGDLLTAVPALRALRRAHRHARLVLATPGTLEPLVRLVGGVDRVHDTADLASFIWTGPRPALAINMHGRGPQSHRALLAAEPSRLIAFDCPAAGVPGPTWDAHEHEVVRWNRLLSEGLGLSVDVGDGLLGPSSPHAPREWARGCAGVIIVHPGAAAAARRWPAERYAELARRLDSHRPVVVTGSTSEGPLVARVAAAAGLPAGRMLVGLPLAKLAAVVATADLVVSGDTGMAHLAAAYDRPAVALFGPIPPETWAPRWGRSAVLWQGSNRGDPHALATDPALLAIEVDAVWEVAASQLAAAGAQRRPTVWRCLVPAEGLKIGHLADGDGGT